MATSQPPDLQGTPLALGFNQGINLDQINENIYPVNGEPAPHLTNTGILRDNGVTNLYETTAVDSNGEFVFYAPNGKKISILASTAPGSIFIDGNKIGGSAAQYAVSSRVRAPFGAIDVAISSTQTWLLLTKTQNASGFRVFQISEYDPTTSTVTGTRNLTETYGYPTEDYACFVKASSMTLANADVADLSFSGTTVTARISVSGTFRTIFNALGKAKSFIGISAFSNAGTYIMGGIPDNTSMPRSYYSATPAVGPWTAVAESSYLTPSVTSIIFNGATAAISLRAVPWSGSTANFVNFSTTIGISAVGVVTVTPSTVAGLVIVPSDTHTMFGAMAGRYKSTAATQFSPFLDSAARSDKTVTAYAVIPEATYVNGSSVWVQSIDGIPTHVVASEPSGNGIAPGAVLNEYGNISAYSPVILWTNTSGGVNPRYVVIPGLDGVYVVTISVRTGYKIFPISKDVVQLNDLNACIIDTVKGVVEYNVSGSATGFFGDMYLAGSNQVAWQTTGIYSNAADAGLVATTAGSTAGVAGFTTAQIPVTFASVHSDAKFFQSASGTLFADNITIVDNANPFSGIQVNTDMTVAYVQNSNLPVPIDAIYKDGGIQLLSGSALQTVNFDDSDGFAQYYAGYTVANQYPVSYQFFNLFGQLYGFDGTKISRMPVNGATAGTPEQVAIATGLTFIANSPVIAWFWSSFDNTLYSFNGGASIEHWQPMTGVALVSSGVFNSRENALFLQLADNTTLIFRDGLGGQFANAFTSQTMYSTDLGVYFVNNSTPTTSKTWSYYSGTGTPITLTWQSGFYGQQLNRYCRLTQAVFVFKVPDPATTNITVNYKWIIENSNGTETATFTGGTYTASSTGYVRIQYNPTQAYTYGFSLGISCTKKITLYELTAYYTDGGIAPVSNRLP